jgi:hypothetical protein
VEVESSNLSPPTNEIKGQPLEGCPFFVSTTTLVAVLQEALFPNVKYLFHHTRIVVQ